MSPLPSGKGEVARVRGALAGRRLDRTASRRGRWSMAGCDSVTALDISWTDTMAVSVEGWFQVYFAHPTLALHRLLQHLCEAKQSDPVSHVSARRAAHRRNVGVYVTSILAGAFAFGVGFDVGIESFWDKWNRGVSGRVFLRGGNMASDSLFGA
jgi:Ubiquinol-cytochrome C reductase, UQCRX/QCR9 like